MFPMRFARAHPDQQRKVKPEEKDSTSSIYSVRMTDGSSLAESLTRSVLFERP